MPIGKNSIKRAGLAASKKNEAKAEFAIGADAKKAIATKKETAEPAAKIKQEVKPEIKPEVKPETKAKAKAKAKPETKPKAKKETKPAEKKPAAEKPSKKAKTVKVPSSPKVPRPSVKPGNTIVQIETLKIRNTIIDNAAAEKAYANVISEVRAKGVQPAVGLVKRGDSYFVISGHEKVYAAYKIRLKTVPAIVFSNDENGAAIANDADKIISEIGKDIEKEQDKGKNSSGSPLPIHLL